MLSPCGRERCVSDCLTCGLLLAITAAQAAAMALPGTAGSKLPCPRTARTFRRSSYKTAARYCQRDGRVTTVASFAIRMLLRGRDARKRSSMRRAGKVRGPKAWLIRPSELVKYGKDETLDAMEDADDIYNESRYNRRFRDADAGAVLAIRLQLKSVRSFLRTWSFQNRLPSISSRYVLTAGGMERQDRDV